MKYMAGLGLHCSEATILNRIRRFQHHLAVYFGSSRLFLPGLVCLTICMHLYVEPASLGNIYMHLYVELASHLNPT